LQPAGGRRDAHGLPGTAAQVKRNPVAGTARAALTDMNAGKIRAAVSVKIGDGEMGRRLGRESGRGCPSRRKSQEPAARRPEGRLPNKAFVNPSSHGNPDPRTSQD